MIRLIRLTIGLLGAWVLLLTVIRGLQPAEATANYRIIYGDEFGNVCCATYLINEAKPQASQVQIGLTRQNDNLSNISPSRRWRFVNVLLNTTSNYQAYLISLADQQPHPLPPQVAEAWLAHWDQDEDVLYYFARKVGSFDSALFRLTPQDPDPVRLTKYIFGSVRAIQEQPLPHTTFTPWFLLLWGGLAVFIAGGMAVWQKPA